MTKLLSIIVFALGTATAVSAQNFDHADWKPILQYVQPGTDLSGLTHEDVHALLVIISSTEHEDEIRRAVRHYISTHS